MATNPQPPSSDRIPMVNSEPMSKDSSPARTFTFFPKLALELRRMIWKHVATQPRVVSFSQVTKILGGTGYNQTPYYGSYLSMSLQRCIGSQPAVLQVCRESRAECLSFFELVGGVYLENCYKKHPTQTLRSKMFSHDPKVYFNPSVDILLLDHDLLRKNRLRYSQSIKNHCGVSPRSIAFPIKSTVFNGPGLGFMVDRILCKAKAIQEIILLYDKEFDTRLVKFGGKVDLVEVDCADDEADSIVDHYYWQVMDIWNLGFFDARQYRAAVKVHGENLNFDIPYEGGSQVWFNNRMVRPGIEGFLNQRMKELLNDEVKEIFTYPKVRIMGIKKYGSDK